MAAMAAMVFRFWQRQSKVVIHVVVVVVVVARCCAHQARLVHVFAACNSTR
jgi:hypothetical protein